MEVYDGDGFDVQVVAVVDCGRGHRKQRGKKRGKRGKSGSVLSMQLIGMGFIYREGFDLIAQPTVATSKYKRDGSDLNRVFTFYPKY